MWTLENERGNEGKEGRKKEIFPFLIALDFILGLKVSV